MNIRSRHLPVCYIAAAIASASFLPAQPQGNVSEIQSQKKEADKEIAQIKGEIGENQKAIKTNLATLRDLEGKIEGSQKEIEVAKGHIETLTRKITDLEKSIDAGEQELKKLRDEYLKAVKKMRVARKKSSPMAFIFASKSFSQAQRRMRYMKEFSEWKDRRQSAISGQVAKLKIQRDELATARRDKDVAYQRQLAAQTQLKKQQLEQTEVVARLRADGDQLRQHLSRKQAESRKLAGQISQLIAQEQAKEAEKKRKAAEEKRLSDQRAAQEKARAEAEAAKAKEDADASKAQKNKEKHETGKPNESTTTDASHKAKPTSGGNEYAEARRRKPRDNQQTKEPGKTSTPMTVETITSSTSTQATSEKGFGGMKGQLPKPVAGNFRIVSAFGVHPVSPDLPDIMDENLGIDAHVAAGAPATSVYEGEVIKIYDRSNTPGFRNIVVVKHNDYITVYANLETVSVHTGQSVKQGQTLGTVGTDFDDPAHGLIHFEVWQGQTRQNPTAWIR